MAIPFLRPSPPKLSELIEELISIEQSGRYTNYGPVNSQFEVELINKVFGGQGACVTTCNATVGLMIAIREAMSEPRGSNVRYALMPSFTFAATAHAAIWAGLTPLLCDIDPQTWLPCPQAEEELLRTHAGEIAVLIPYATFGNNLDLARYDRISSEYGVPVVIDAAASLGSVDENGRGFGTGSRHAIVYSMHATKTFATAEGGVIYCEDSQRVARLRSMGNFGFEVPRTATMPGLNAKLSEIGALLALKRLEDFEAVVAQRTCSPTLIALGSQALDFNNKSASVLLINSCQYCFQSNRNWRGRNLCLGSPSKGLAWPITSAHTWRSIPFFNEHVYRRRFITPMTFPDERCRYQFPTK